MKKQCLILTISLLLSAISYTNAQRCGTTEYYNMRKQNNPEVQSRLDYAEQLSTTWMRNKSVSAFPSIPGFTATGNQVVDIQSYAIAKRNLFTPHTENAETGQSAAAIEKLRVQKRNNNSFVISEGGRK